MKQLTGRTAIVTGASAGIGRHVARALAVRGANLVLAARSLDKLQAVATEVRQCGARVAVIPTDIASTAALEHLVAHTLEEFGRIDILVNNAGMEAWRSFHQLRLDDIEQIIRVNLTAAAVLCRLVIPPMLASGGGHIVNMSSTAGKCGPAYGAAYGASKAGLIALTQALRAEYHGTGVSASVVCPGFTNEGGIYERMKQATGRGTPPWMGGTSADAVARAVVRAIRRNRPELLVNVPPMRPVFVLAEMLPRLGGWLARLATQRFLRRAARAQVSDRSDEQRRAA
jgi:short-subunit dehydrogenase